MSGQHRSADRHLVQSAVKSTRWMVTLGAMVAVPPALLAAAVYLVLFGTERDRWAVAALCWAVVLAGVLARAVRRQGG